MKTHLTFVLAVLMSMVTITSMAYNAYIDDVYYNLSGEKATVTYSEKNTNNKYAYRGAVVIPDSVIWEDKVYYVTAIGEYAFSNCDAMTSIELPESINTIGQYAFQNCSTLTSIKIPQNLSIIDTHVFDGCKRIRELQIPSKVTEIKDGAFEGCSSVRKLIIDDSPSPLTLGWLNLTPNFYRTLKIKEVYIGRDLNYKEYANSSYNQSGSPFFENDSLRVAVIGEMVTQIGPHLFQRCNNLQSIKIGSNVREIKEFAFNSCVTLASVFIPHNVVTIGTDAFWKCEGLKEAIIGNSVSYIGQGAFADCSGLKELTIGKSVGSFGINLIKGSDSLEHIYCFSKSAPKSENEYYKPSSTQQSNTQLHVPASSINIYKTANFWKEFKAIVELVIGVETLEVTENELTVNVGSKTKLGFTISPNDATNKKIIWTSSDSSVVTIDDNSYLIGMKQGNAWVKVTSEDNPEAKDSCLVTVVEPVTGVTISHTEYALNGIGKAIQLEAAVQPNDATNKGVTWSSSNESVCTVKDGLVTAKGKGTAIISVKTDDGGFTASCTVTVTQAVTGITLNYENYTLNNIGESVQLTATVTPEDADNKAITWASLNENVCRVTNGYVLAVGEGTTIITATSADGEVSAKCTVTVKVPKAVTGVTLDKETLILHAIGESAQLTANVLPEDAGNKNVTWSTSNDAVCMVSNTGKVVATGEGSAVITVKTEDGSFTASCNVRVSISHPVTGITLNQESITFDVIGQSAQLVATVVPNEATEKGVTWSSSNESVCMVSSTGFIVAVGNGTADITATTIDGGFTTTCKVKVEDITPVGSIDAKAQGYKVFDLQGRVRVRLQKGVNIIRVLDGTTKKVLVK